MNVMQRKTGNAGEVLHVDSVPVPEIVAAVGSPVYVYSRAYFEARYRALADAVAGCGTGGRVCYAVKANSNLAVLRLFADLGAGFAAIDLVGERLMEVNVANPGGLGTLASIGAGDFGPAVVAAITDWSATR